MCTSTIRDLGTTSKRIGRFISEGRASGICCTGGSRAGLDAVQESSLASVCIRTPAVRPVVRRCTD
jgi:hypothetical protein